MKKHFTLIMLSLSLILATVSSCKKEKIERSPNLQTENKNFKFAKNTFLVTSKDGEQIIFLDSNTIVFPNSVDVAHRQIGDILIAEISSKTPQGFIERVLEIRKEGGNVRLETEPATLPEAYEYLHIDTTITFVDPDKHGKTDGLSDLDLSLPKISNLKVNAEANLSVQSNLYVQLDVSNGKTNFAVFSLNTVERYDGNVSLSGTVSQTLNFQSKDKYLPTVQIYFVTITPYFNCRGNLTAEVTASVNASTSVIKTKYTEVKYQNGVLSSYATSSESKQSSFTTIAANSSLTLNIHPEFNFSLYRINNAHVGLGANLNLMMKSNPCEITANINAQVHARLKVLGVINEEISSQLYYRNFLIKSCNSNGGAPVTNGGGIPSSGGGTNPGGGNSGGTNTGNTNPPSASTNIFVTNTAQNGVLDFGSVLVGQYAARNITIKNNGNIQLTGNFVLPQGFSCSSNSFSISPYQQETFNLIFTPTSASNYSGTFNISSNATSGSGFPFVVKGLGFIDQPNTGGNGGPVTPGSGNTGGGGGGTSNCASVSTTFLDFGNVSYDPGTYEMKIVNLYNTCSTNGTYSVSSTPNSLFQTLQISGNVLPANGQGVIALPVYFYKNSIGANYGTMTVTTGDGQVFNISLTGNIY